MRHLAYRARNKKLLRWVFNIQHSILKIRHAIRLKGICVNGEGQDFYCGLRK